MTGRSVRPAPRWIRETPVAHRGFHGAADRPENSLAAFAAAAESGYAVELDVRLSADGKVVVFHDADLARMTGAAGAVEATATSSLTALRLAGGAERIPLLADVLDLIAGRVPLLVEIKRGPGAVGALEAATLQALEGYDGEFAIQSFSEATVAYLAEHAPDVARGQLATNDRWRELDEEGPLPDFLGYLVDALPTPLTARLRGAGLSVLAWTVKTPEQRAHSGAHADNIIFEGFAA